MADANKPANTWPKKPRIIGTKVPRVDGPAKATGTAKYSYDINRPGMLHATILRSPYAHAKIKSIDTAAAEKMPGVKATHIIAKPGSEVYYAGDEVVALAADTEEHCHDAIRAIKVEYEVLPFLVKEEDALKAVNLRTVAGREPSNLKVGGEFNRGNVDDAFQKADAVSEGTYGVPTIAHQCLESHGLVAEWEKENFLKVWCSTQATFYTAQLLAQHFKIPATNVECITYYMGGGFGSKFGPDVQGIAAAELAKKAGAPVKLMLNREDEIIAAGNRPSAAGKVKIAASKDGKITAYDVDCYGSPGVGGGATVNFQYLPYVYDIAETVPNVRRKNTVVRLNTGQNRAMRAPGHPQSCFLTETAVDDLAAKLGVDPLQVRLKNLPQNDPQAAKKDPQSFAALRNTIYAEEIDIAVKLSKWKDVWHPPGKGPGKGPIKHGIGMALHLWTPKGGPDNDTTVTVSSDGSVTVQSSTQDLGTGQRTLLAIIVAEVLGLDVKNIQVKIGDSLWGRSTGSGGSTTAPGTAPAALNAASAARVALFEKIAPRLNVKAADLAIEPGKIVDKNGGSWSWKEACARLGMDTVKGEGNYTEGLTSYGVGGVQTAEVLVDSETGVVRCTKVVAVQDCGMVINKLACESQVAGGVVMALNYVLFEENILDRHTGRQVNPDMEFYKLGGIEDMPHIIVHMHDMPERGVIGIGEPPTISTAAAVSNAVFNALGVRVPYAPFTPARVLAALAKA